jgi:hypothetical protein
MNRPLLAALALAGAALAAPALAQPAAVPCPAANLLYWQAFPPGGESDLSARHQQLVLKKKCPAIETVIQYKAGRGRRPDVGTDEHPAADGLNVVGINLPHIVLQPMEGNVSYKTEDVTPVFWFHYTPDVLVVAERARSRPSPTSSRRRRPTRARSTSAARASTRPTTRRTSGWTGVRRSRRPTCRTRAPATSRSPCSAATSTAR